MLCLNMKADTSVSFDLKNTEDLKMKLRRYMNLRKRKLKVDSDKTCSLNSDIHGEGEIEQELEEDNEKIFKLLTLLYLNNL